MLAHKNINNKKISDVCKEVQFLLNHLILLMLIRIVITQQQQQQYQLNIGTDRLNGNVLLSTWQFLMQGQKNLNLESLDSNVKFRKSYDFIIVGAGTAGCTLAARLSENPQWNVLLLEAGGPEMLVMDVPVFVHFLQLNPELNWQYRTEPSAGYCQGLKDNRCNWPRGKVMGGSSVLNYMMYTRGNRRDYDRWAQLGNPGWSYHDILPYFKKLEGSTIPDTDNDLVGREGPVKISYAPWFSIVADAFVNATQELGSKYCDYNGHRQTCVNYLQSTAFNGLRWSSNRAYLYPLKGKRPNLHIYKRAMVTKVLIDPKTKQTFGVLFESQGKSFKILAKKEVILSAGAINTPQLLMLSGIGPAKHLRSVNITPLVDLAVGYNLQDHISTFITFATNTSTLQLHDFFDVNNVLNYQYNRYGKFSTNGVEAISFFDMDDPLKEDGWPDMEHFFITGGLNTNPAVPVALGIKPELYNYLYQDILKSGTYTFLIFPMILRPKSRGRLKLQNNNPYKHPLLYANYLSHPYDMDILVRGVLKCLKLAQQPSFQRINATLLERLIPQCRKYGGIQSRQYWECYIRHFTMTIYHYSGTAKMGPKTDRTAVVDARLRVHGIKNLRVVDASIMPELISGHPNGPIFMIAEKAADMIKEDYKLR